MSESKAAKSDRARAIVERLGEAWPEASTALVFASPLELMVAVVLSAQCTDVRVNKVTPGLFAKLHSVEDFARVGQLVLEGNIKSCGLYRNKAKGIIGACQAILAAGGEVPTTREALARLPGIGNKSAGVIAMHLSATERAFPVDTHVARLALRMGLTREKDPDRIERDLQALLPSELWKPAHHRLILHGRAICTARSPKCDACPIEARCPKRGVARGSK